MKPEAFLLRAQMSDSACWQQSKPEAHWLSLLQWYEEARMSTARDWVVRDGLFERA
jgi:hypothetical protein